MPKITIIIPVFKAERFIERCLNSICCQTLQDFEVICIDDHSPDKSNIIINKFVKNDVRFKCYKNKSNMGPMYSRMEGIKMAQGDYIGFCDSDDTLPDKSLELMYDAAIKSNADVVSGNMIYFWLNGKTKEILSTLDYGTDKVSVYKSLLKSEFQHILCNKIIKRSILQEYKYEIFINAKRGEDLCMFYQVVDNCTKIIQIPDFIYNYIENSKSSSHERLRKEDIKSLILANIIRRNTCGKYYELNELLYRRISISLCELFEHWAGSNLFLKEELRNNNLMQYLSIRKMFYCFSINDFLKLLVKRYVFPVINRLRL